MTLHNLKTKQFNTKALLFLQFISLPHSRQEEIEKHAGVVAQERREEEEEPAGGSGMVMRIGSVRFEDD